MHDLWMDQLSDYLDGDLPREQTRDLESHLETCADCRTAFEELKQVRERAASLVDPPVPDDLWAGIATRIGAAGSTSEGGANGQSASGPARVVSLPVHHRRWAFSLPQLAAAGFLLVVGSAATVWTLRGNLDRGAVATRGGAPAVDTAQAPAATLATFDAERVEGEITALQQALERGRERLDPQTVIVLEKNLTLIRQATEEARRALEADPANADLQQYLAGTVQRKLDMMKRATAMAGI